MAASLPSALLLALTLLAGTVFASPPNIVFMMADDMGMGDTSAYQDFNGNSDAVQVHTPNMERLARMGIRFTDAHTPASRCTPTRYGLLTGRYPWRNRLKFWVLFGSQGDPMIESDRPTIASMLRDNGYSTAMFGKWHVGLRYRQTDGRPASGWLDADLTKPLHTTPIDHGFDVARFTSRSHDTSGPDPSIKKPKKNKRNTPDQMVGPGHIHGRSAIGVTGDGRKLVSQGPKAYILRKLGSRHSDHAIGWLSDHVTSESTQTKPFFLYYPSNSNHGPYTPDQSIDGVSVAGAARTVAGEPMDRRHDFIFENDVALGRLMDWLANTPDPRRNGKPLIDNTLVIFTSDNGAEKNSDIATGPFRSNKGSCYEGGHRVPFIACWPVGSVGDGDPTTQGKSSATPIGLHDMYATFSELVGVDLPDLRSGAKGGEDSFSVLPALRGQPMPSRPPLFVHDHKESKSDPAVAAVRVDSPTIDGQAFPGQWKAFFDARLLRHGDAHPTELYNLAEDAREAINRIGDDSLQPLLKHLSDHAELHRNSGGHRIAEFASNRRWEIDLTGEETRAAAAGKRTVSFQSDLGGPRLTATLTAVGHDAVFEVSSGGLGIVSGTAEEGDSKNVGGQSTVDGPEAITIEFSRDVIVESLAVEAGPRGNCGGFYRIGDRAPLAIYCVDADNDAKDQSGKLSDLGVVKAGEAVRLDAGPHFGVESAGSWRLQQLRVRFLRD